MSSLRNFLSSFTERPAGAPPRSGGLGRWFEILEIHPMKLFWVNLLTFAFLAPCAVCLFFFINMWDWLSMLGVWLFFGLAGPGITALHFICFKIARGTPVWLREDCKACIRREWKKSIALSLIVAALWLSAAYAVKMTVAVKGALSMTGFLFFLIYGYLLTGFSIFSYQQLAMLEIPFVNVLKNGFLLIFAGKGESVKAIICSYAIILLSIYFYNFSFFLLLLGFYALAVLTANFIFMPAFDRLFPDGGEPAGDEG